MKVKRKCTKIGTVFCSPPHPFAPFSLVFLRHLILDIWFWYLFFCAITLSLCVSVCLSCIPLSCLLASTIQISVTSHCVYRQYMFCVQISHLLLFHFIAFVQLDFFARAQHFKQHTVQLKWNLLFQQDLHFNNIVLSHSLAHSHCQVHKFSTAIA